VGGKGGVYQTMVLGNGGGGGKGSKKRVAPSKVLKNAEKHKKGHRGVSRKDWVDYYWGKKEARP